MPMVALMLLIVVQGHATTHATTHEADRDLADLIQKVNAVGPEGKGHESAIEAMKELSRLPASAIPKLLKGMNRSNRLSMNWLRSAVESAASHGDLPVAEVQAFLADHSNSPYARRLAFELLVARYPERRKPMLKEMLDDPSLEIRRDAVQLMLDQIAGESAKEDRIRGYRKALNHAREITQIRSIADKLEELGDPVDLTRHFGMLTDWHLIGPFPNKDQARFDTVYPPEKEIDLTATYQGDEDRKISWKKFSAPANSGKSEEEGIVDLNKALGPFKGAIAYAYTEFNSDQDREVDVRLGCINANKVWINGTLVISNNVYHAGMNLDQYIGKAKLRKGVNRILIKVCQNEQTEPWAQNWHFQFRITDSSGKAIRSK